MTESAGYAKIYISQRDIRFLDTNEVVPAFYVIEFVNENINKEHDSASCYSDGPFSNIDEAVKFLKTRIDFYLELNYKIGLWL